MGFEEFIARTNNFALECVRLTDLLPDTKIGNHIRGQLIRCSTSVAANYRATRIAQSKAAFIAKLSVVIEETDEVEFWIDFAIKLNLLKEQTAMPLIKESHELASIFITSRKTLQQKK